MKNQEGLAFEQGVQIFFIQKILAEGYGRAELVGDGAEGDDFFVKWSKIVRDHDGEEGFTRTVTLPENYYQQLHEAKAKKGKKGSLDEVSQYYIDAYKLENPEDVPEPYHKLIEDPRFREISAMLLADINLGDLMQIEYSATIAGVSKQQDLDFLKTDDAVIIKNAIAQELKKEPLDLTEKDYGFVTKLNLTGKKSTDITFLKQCKNLRELYLYDNQISDISALKGLTNLTELWLSSNQISDISVLKGLTNLTQLALSDNQISDISVLKGLTNLTHLVLFGNQISNISTLAGLTKLTELWLANNQISDISPISDLTSLKELYLSNTKIIDIKPLKDLTKLILLDLNNTEINDLTPIMGLDKLTHLYVSTTQLDNIQAIGELVNLRLLGITSTKVSDLSPIKKLNHLDALFFSGTPVDTLEPLKDLKKLRVLSFQNTNIDTLEPLKDLTGLQTLKIQNTPINSLKPIKGLSNLKELFLEGCEKITIEQISDLQKSLPDCKILATAIKTALLGTNWLLFFNPNKRPKKSKIMHFGENGTISDGQNSNESSWRIRNGLLELLDSDKKVHSRFRYNPDKNRFDHTNDPDTGSIRKHSIRDQYMLPEK